jgi:hypothetical protein
MFSSVLFLMFYWEFEHKEMYTVTITLFGKAEGNGKVVPVLN